MSAIKCFTVQGKSALALAAYFENHRTCAFSLGHRSCEKKASFSDEEVQELFPPPEVLLLTFCYLSAHFCALFVVITSS